MTSLPGTVREIRTPSGGGKVWLTIESQYGTFTNSDSLQRKNLFHGTRDIQRGSREYATIAELAVGDPVQVNMEQIDASDNPFVEHLAVCGDEWLARFTKVVRLD